MSFNSLPNEVQLLIFNYLTQRELVTIVARVSKRWKELAYDASLWRKIKLDYRKHESVDTMLKLLDRTLVYSESKLRELNLCYFENWELTKHFENYHFILTTMNFYECKLNADVLSVLFKQCPKLEVLNVLSCKTIDEKAIEEIVKCKNLRHLHLYGCRTLDGNKCIQRVTSECRRLENFHLTCGGQINNSCLLAFANLKDIHFKRVIFKRESFRSTIEISATRKEESKIIDENHKNKIEVESSTMPASMFTSQFGGIINRFINITKVTIKNCKYFDDEGLRIITESCPTLRELNCDGCSAITDNGLLAIVCNCRSLQTLSLQNHPSITGRILLRYPFNFPDLTLMNFIGSFLVLFDDESVERILLQHPNLTIFDGEGKSVKTKMTQWVRAFGKDFVNRNKKNRNKITT